MKDIDPRIERALMTLAYAIEDGKISGVATELLSILCPKDEAQPQV